MQQTKYRKTSELKSLPNNPRLIKDAEFERLCRSIEDNPDYFLARPLILSDRTGELVIIAGNQRHKAAKHLKLKQVPTFLMSGLTEEKEREVIIRDNHSNGEWDFDMLRTWDQDELIEWGLDVPLFEEGSLDDSNDQEEKTSFKIELSFKNESQQNKAYDKFIADGYDCRLL